METKYIPLYRKYRPQTFHDMIGQENIVRALSNAIEQNKIAHAYLFCGPRGTGKTSSARILAKSLNCKEGPTLNPCGKCPACTDIMNSVPVDVVEIDAASNRSVEDAQAILEKICYVPVNGRYKIYVIDEVHMLSNTAFNALLKTLEEPPANVIFILATTEPHKVLDTIISRCQRFDFRRITTDDIVKRLEYISREENINISKEALCLTAKNSQGGMRDALALLDQVSVLGINKQIDVNDINEILGKISYDTLYEITRCIAASDCFKSVELIDNIYSKGNEPVQIVSNLIQYFRDLMIIKNCTDKELIYSLTQINESDFERLKKQAQNFTVSQIVQLIDKLAYYTAQIKDTTDKYLWLELCIIDLTNYKNLPSAENLLKRIEVLENKLSQGNYGIENRSAVISKALSTEIEKEKAEVLSQITENVEVQNNEPIREISQSSPETKPQVQGYVKNSSNQISARQNNSAASEQNSDMHSLWVSVLQSIESPPCRAFYSNLAHPVEITENKIVIAFTKELFVKQAKEGAKKQALVNAVSKYFTVSNPIIEIITNDNIDLTAKISVQSAKPIQKTDCEQVTLQKQEEEEYHEYIEAQNKEETSQTANAADLNEAEMVKELFNGKYID